MNKLIKIYGERNTNTNYMSKLIKLNLDAHEIPGIVPDTIMKLQKRLPGNELVKDIYFYLTYGKNLGWKHTQVKSIEVLKSYAVLKNYNVAFITITKNPYSWLLSLYRRPYHQYYTEKLDFETFLQRPWETIGRDNVKVSLKSPIELWNIKNLSYLHLKELNGLNIKTESIFEHPGNIIEQISHHFSIKKLSDKFINYDRSTKDESKDSKYYRDYYLNETWRNKISSEAIAIINGTIDKKLMSHFNYNLLP